MILRWYVCGDSPIDPLEGSICVRISRAVLVRWMRFQSLPCLRRIVGRFFFFLVSWACNFWMVGVIRDTFLANAFVNTSLVSLSLSLEWYKAFRVVQGARRG